MSSRSVSSILIEAARGRGEPLDHVLFSGPPGLGKTTLAAILADGMGAQLRATSGPVLERAGDLAAILSNLQAGDVMFIDEVHRLPRVVEEILYTAMEDFQLDIVIGKGAGANSIRLELPPFTLIGATTRVGRVSAPLRDRFGYLARIDYYRPQELEAIVGRSARIMGIVVDDAGRRAIAQRSRGTPRIANRLLRRVRDFAAVRADGAVDATIAEQALEVLRGRSGRARSRRPGDSRSRDPQVRRRPGRPVHAGDRGVRRDPDRRRRLRALPAADGLPAAHPPWPYRHRVGVSASRSRSADTERAGEIALGRL